MLLNLSNHPVSRWPEMQLKEAELHFGSVQDMPFPLIDPAWDERQVAELVTLYFEEIVKLHPRCVHLMGELTFTFGLVEKLKRESIPVIASTTHRVVVELPDGSKNVKFEFIRFRKYL
ncbi:CRISPR-associated protein [Nitritalea halalkaliphila LW7]|uniref:CRISPR-associated protein n=1 Tax=Nitritalea halalkaliphila LW7 TaxID=1189621 RepID=I5BRW7_9BACT|nr:hypothetical protein [Nitritalea halalkaliphila]EIM72319.1 CRISPR-associated protein [Nitritalea halalkaliphila LW7]